MNPFSRPSLSILRSGVLPTPTSEDASETVTVRSPVGMTHFQRKQGCRGVSSADSMGT